MSLSTIQQLADYGQSVWLDYISRPLLETGQLKDLIQNGLRGMTSNPSIFNQAIGSSNDYDQKIIELKTAGKSTFEIYDELTIKDIQDAADMFKDVYQNTSGLDGYVSLEINPLLASQVDEQIREGQRLYKKVNRSNVMIKVPSTEAGFKVIEALTADGINVNVTLIFSLDQYIKTTQAYCSGLRRYYDKHGDLSKVRSVASVFVSRIDSKIDTILDQRRQKEPEEGKRFIIQSLLGKAAVSNCRVIYEKYKDIFNGDEFAELKQKGANEQRVLWGSTSTKNPQYPDIKYVAELIARPTINTIPEKTLRAFLDHGEVKDAFDTRPKEAEKVIKDLKNFGIDVNDICRQLLDEGCQSFDEAFKQLLASVEKKAQALVAN